MALEIQSQGRFTVTFTCGFMCETGNLKTTSKVASHLNPINYFPFEVDC